MGLVSCGAGRADLGHGGDPNGDSLDPFNRSRHVLNDSVRAFSRVADAWFRAPEGSGQPVVPCFDSIVLVAVDGVRSEDILVTGESNDGTSKAAHELPELADLRATGLVWGYPQSTFHASGPNFVSLPGYMEMLSGTSKTDCTENDCSTMKRRTLLDDFAAAYPDESSAVIASWSKLGVAASSNPSPPGFVSTGRVHLVGSSSLGSRSRAELDRGYTSSQAHGSERTDADTARLALTYYREHQPRFLFVGLGETDEHAHQGDLDGYWDALRFADTFIGELRREQAEQSANGASTVLFVTTDHGRAHNFKDHGRTFPESSRSFLLMETNSPLALQRTEQRHGKERYLKDIAPTIRALCNIEHPKDADGETLGRGVDRNTPVRPRKASMKR